jgi:hypothetical protein
MLQLIGYCRGKFSVGALKSDHAAVSGTRNLRET